jgi:hypothetical protein
MRDQCRRLAVLAVLVFLLVPGLCDHGVSVELKGLISLEISARAAVFGPDFGSSKETGARNGVRDPEDREAARKQSSVDDVAEITVTRGPSGTSPSLSAGVLSRVA